MTGSTAASWWSGSRPPGGRSEETQSKKYEKKLVSAIDRYELLRLFSVSGNKVVAILSAIRQRLFSVQDAAGAVRLFRTEFFTVAGALTAVLFLGLSALGPLPIFLFTMLYGTGSGLLSSRLLVDLNPRTAFVLLCVCGIPASLAAGTLCTFGASALQVSGRLCSAAFGRGGQAPSTGALLGQFARMLFLLLPLCGAAVGMLYLAGQAKLI